MTSSASWQSALIFLSLILSSSFVKSSSLGNQLVDGACDEVYVVGEGESLHMISDKCGDPFIVEQNPHIQDPDDVFPGLVIKITPFKSRKLLSTDVSVSSLSSVWLPGKR